MNINVDNESPWNTPRWHSNASLNVLSYLTLDLMLMYNDFIIFEIFVNYVFSSQVVERFSKINVTGKD